MKYFLVVGEASGDLHASNLIKAIRAKDPCAKFEFMGGDKMKNASDTIPIVHYKDMAFMGIIPVIKNLSVIKNNAIKIQEHIKKFDPDIVIPVDYGSFCFKYILPFVKKETNAKIAYFIAPKLWAWKKWRIKTLRKYVDLLLCILPFEEEYFTKKGVKAKYVGNPCVDAINDYNDNIVFDKEIQKKQIAILPGSRKQEIHSNLKICLDSIKDFAKNNKIVIAAAPSLTNKDFEHITKKYPFVYIEFGNTYKVINDSDIAVVTSGTATLETALIGTPQIVIYRMNGSRMVRLVFKHLFSIPFISLVNIIGKRQIVKELLGNDANSNNILEEIINIQNDNKYRQSIIEGYRYVKSILGNNNSSDITSQLILELVNQNDNK